VVSFDGRYLTRSQLSVCLQLRGQSRDYQNIADAPYSQFIRPMTKRNHLNDG